MSPSRAVGCFIALLVVTLGLQGLCLGDEAQVCNRRAQYMGMTPPGLTPEVFAPGLVSTDAYEVAGTFSPDGLEYFFTRRPDEGGADNRLYYTRFSDGAWTEPDLAPFARDVMEFEPHITPAGDRVYFNSKRPGPEGTTGTGEIWYSDRTDSGWSEAHYLEGPVNEGSAMYVTSTEGGTLYMTGVYTVDGERKYGIFRSRMMDGVYGAPEYLPDEVNGILPAHPYVAPDEAYLVFDAYTAGQGRPELYVSFRKEGGGWTVAEKLGPTINATQTEYAASVSPDGKYLFFHRLVEGKGDIYWVDASLVEMLRPE